MWLTYDLILMQGWTLIMMAWNPSRQLLGLLPHLYPRIFPVLIIVESVLIANCLCVDLIQIIIVVSSLHIPIVFCSILLISPTIYSTAKPWMP
jgi:hypothetical protein